MKLYDYYRSSASYRVRIALNLKDIAYETIPIDLIKDGGEQHNTSYYNINPQSLVPTLIDKGQTLSQSLAIIEYLEEIKPTPPLLPDNAPDRALVRSLALTIACDIHPLNNLRVLQHLKKQFDASGDQITDWYHLWLEKGLQGLEARLQQLPRSNDVCFGNQVTLADICLIPQLYNAKRFHFSLSNYPLISKINDYCLTIPEFIAASPDKQMSD